MITPRIAQDVAYRLRTAAETAARQIDRLAGATPTEAEMLRTDLRGLTLMMVECADELHPICETAVSPKLPACLVRAGFGLS